MKLDEISQQITIPRGKAGLIPYFVDDGKIKLMFMISSNGNFGGTDPMISKGHVDRGEDMKIAAVREAEEELGLKQTNIVDGTLDLGWSGVLTGMDATYRMDVYIAEVKFKDDFNEPHFETGRTLWLTPQEFATHGRRSQRHIVRACESKISERL